jgi:hypothetical protein
LVDGVEADLKHPDAVPVEMFGSLPSISLAEVKAMGCRDGRHAFWKTRDTGKVFVIQSKNGEAAFRSLLNDGFSEANIKQAMERVQFRTRSALQLLSARFESIAASPRMGSRRTPTVMAVRLDRRSIACAQAREALNELHPAQGSPRRR